MSREKGGVYQRGGLWLGFDCGRDGKPRSPNYHIFRYSPEKGRIVSTSTRTGDAESAKRALDRIYLQESRGAAVCQACGQMLPEAHGFLLADAIANYQVEVGDNRTSSEAIAARLAHVLDYIETLPRQDVACDDVDELWIGRFRQWMAAKPIVSKYGKSKSRTPATVENSVIQLAAAINHARARKDTLHGAGFQPRPVTSVNQTPRWRASVRQIADMFQWAIDQGKRGEALHRFLAFSVSTLARPDAALDFSTAPAREQWNASAGIIDLNPRGRPQTKKHRATVRCPDKLTAWIDATPGQFVRNQREAVSSIRSAWDSMRADLNMPSGAAGGSKCIRRSMATLLRARKCPIDQLEMQLGHRVLRSVTETYAPYSPDYLADVLAMIGAIMSEIETLVPQAFTGIEPENEPSTTVREGNKSDEFQ